MTDIFLSGWCGFSPLFGSFADRFQFSVPFYDDIDGVFDKTGRNLVCWSTGANLALRAEKLDFENIILLSPFIKFTDFTPERVLKRMIKKFESEPETVIADFLTACGCKDYSIPELNDYSNLKSGLEYLMDSSFELKKKPNIKILHGEDDAVVNKRSGELIAEILGCELVCVKNCGHFVSPDIIAEHLI